MKKHSVWQKIQAVMCFVILLCVFAPMALIAVSPATAVSLLTGALLDDAMSQAVAGITWMQRAVIGAGVIIGVLCALRMLMLMFSRPRRDSAGVSLTNATEGEIHISVPAVETLVSEGIRDVPGLSDVRMKVYDHRDSISIEMTMSARSDINIPETMMRLQTRIKDYVQESAGVEVHDVRLNVDRVVLADPVPALPAGRGGRRMGAAPQPADEQPAAHRGLFGRKGARQRAGAQQPEPQATADEAGSVSEFLRSYENGGEPETAAQESPAEPVMADEPVTVVADEPEAASVEPEAAAGPEPVVADEPAAAAPVETVVADGSVAADAPADEDAAQPDEEIAAVGDAAGEPLVIGDTAENMDAQPDGDARGADRVIA
ncbi:MAG: alkaline shock response membrane anchor protein AmaP, partial [Candidatus Fimadaptatus sp.]